MLTKSEREQVEEEFASALAIRANPKSLINVVFTTEAGPILLDAPSDLPKEIARHAVGACLVSRWTLRPSLLEMLLEYLVNTRGVGALNTVLVRVRQGIDPNRSVYDAAWLIGQRPFFDRQDFRLRVRRLIEDNGRPILRVSAAVDSFGRTYSRYFLEHLEDCSPDTVHVLPAQVSVGTGPSYQVCDLLQDVDAQLAVEDPIPPRAGSSYPTAAALWMLKQMMKRPGRWLVVLDGFGQKELNPEVRETIEALAVRVPVGQHRRRIRLILLDYPQPLPGVSPADVLEEVLPLAAGIVRADLEPCLEGWDADRKRHGMTGMAAGELAKLAEGMLGRAPQTGKERLEMLNTELSKLYDF